MLELLKAAFLPGKILMVFLYRILINILSIKSQSAQQFRVGGWKIKSQSLDGQELDSDQWIVPKVKPQQSQQFSMRIPRTHVLDTQLLENHGSYHLQQRTPGTPRKPSFSELWLDHRGGSGRPEYQDSK